MSTAAQAASLPIGNRFRRSPGWWAMVWIVATESALFAYLLFAYYYLASMFRGPWPPDGFEPFHYSAAMTGIMLLSSWTVQWAHDGITRGQHMRLRFGLLATILLGLAFGALEGFEWASKSYTPESHAYGALFFTITGIHLVHIMVGIVINLFVMLWAWTGKFTEERHLAVTNATLYWHFNVVVWAFVFFSFYVAPRIG